MLQWINENIIEGIICIIKIERMLPRHISRGRNYLTTHQASCFN